MARNREPVGEHVLKLTQPIVDDYVASGGLHCPFCKSRSLDAEPPKVGDCDDDLYEDVTCNNCGQTWTDVYKLAGICGAPMTAKFIDIGVYGMQVILTDTGKPSYVSSSLSAMAADNPDAESELLDRVSTLEAFVLNAAVAGIDVASEQFRGVITATVEDFIHNH